MGRWVNLASAELENYSEHSARIVELERERDETKVEAAELREQLRQIKNRPVEREYCRLDTMWQELVHERDNFKRERDALRVDNDAAIERICDTAQERDELRTELDEVCCSLGLNRGTTKNVARELDRRYGEEIRVQTELRKQLTEARAHYARRVCEKCVGDSPPCTCILHPLYTTGMPHHHYGAVAISCDALRIWTDTPTVGG